MYLGHTKGSFVQLLFCFNASAQVFNKVVTCKMFTLRFNSSHRNATIIKLSFKFFETFIFKNNET